MGNTSFLNLSVSQRAGFHGAVNFALGITGRGRVPLVIQFFALGKTDFQLHAGVLEINGQGDEGVAVLLDLAEQPQDLPLVHQQTAGAAGILVEDIALLIGADVHPQNGELTILDDAEGILQIHIALTDGLDFGARKLNTGLELFLDELVVVCLVVFCNNFDGFFSGHGAPPFKISSFRIVNISHYESNCKGIWRAGDV